MLSLRARRYESFYVPPLGKLTQLLSWMLLIWNAMKRLGNLKWDCDIITVSSKCIQSPACFIAEAQRLQGIWQKGSTSMMTCTVSCEACEMQGGTGRFSLPALCCPEYSDKASLKMYRKRPSASDLRIMYDSSLTARLCDCFSCWMFYIFARI